MKLSGRRAVEAQFSLCDDFLPQFALASDIGLQFNDAWFAARQVIDLGCRAAKPNPLPPPKPMIAWVQRGEHPFGPK